MNEYAAYRGDNIVGVGTIKQLSKSLDIEQKTARFYASPAYLRRVADVKKPRGTAIYIIKIEDEL